MHIKIIESVLRDVEADKLLKIFNILKPALNVKKRQTEGERKGYGVKDLDLIVYYSPSTKYIRSLKTLFKGSGNHIKYQLVG